MIPASIISPFGKVIGRIMSEGVSVFSLQCIKVSSKSKTIVFFAFFLRLMSFNKMYFKANLHLNQPFYLLILLKVMVTVILKNKQLTLFSINDLGQGFAILFHGC